MSTDPNRRFPPPWHVKEHEEAYSVSDASGFAFLHLYFETRTIVGTSRDRLTKDQARRLAKNIAKLPELLKTSPAPP